MFFNKKNNKTKQIEKITVDFLEDLSISDKDKRQESLESNGFIYGGIWDIDNDHSATYYTRLYSASIDKLLFIPEVIMLHKRSYEISYNIFVGLDLPNGIPNFLESFYLDILSNFYRKGYRTFPEHGVHDMKLRILDSDMKKYFNLTEIPVKAKDNGAVLLRAILCYLEDK